MHVVFACFHSHDFVAMSISDALNLLLYGIIDVSSQYPLQARTMQGIESSCPRTQGLFHQLSDQIFANRRKNISPIVGKSL